MLQTEVIHCEHYDVLLDNIKYIEKPGFISPAFCQIRSTIDRPDHNVKIGDLGGYVPYHVDLLFGKPQFDEDSWLGQHAYLLDTQTELIISHIAGLSETQPLYIEQSDIINTTGQCTGEIKHVTFNDVTLNGAVNVERSHVVEATLSNIRIVDDEVVLHPLLEEVNDLNDLLKTINGLQQ